MLVKFFFYNCADSLNLPNYLMVFAAGNGLGQGPGAQPASYQVFDPATQSYVVNNNANVVAFQNLQRNWNNNDLGGFDSMPPYGTAKNVLTVGACRAINGGYNGPATVRQATFSATGPTDDGRIKPDVVAMGQREVNMLDIRGPLAPTDTSDSAYQDFAGTSAAAPMVTSTITLGLERREQFFDSIGVTGHRPWRGSSIKAAVIHTASEAGPARDDTEASTIGYHLGPDFRYGWGLLDAVGLVQLIDQDTRGGGALIRERRLQQGQEFTLLVYSDGITPIRGTLVWTDPAGPAVAAGTVDDTGRALVNDLNLRITNAAGTETFYPWVLRPDLAGETAAVRSAPAVNTVAANGGVPPNDTLNPVEQVFVSAPFAGFYVVKVSHAGTLAGGSQPFSLVVSGANGPQHSILSLTPAAAPLSYNMLFDTEPFGTYRVETSLDLQTWLPITGSSIVNAVASTTAVTVTKSSAEEKRFWRVRRIQVMEP